MDAKTSFELKKNVCKVLSMGFNSSLLISPLETLISDLEHQRKIFLSEAILLAIKSPANVDRVPERRIYEVNASAAVLDKEPDSEKYLANDIASFFINNGIVPTSLVVEKELIIFNQSYRFLISYLSANQA